MRESTIESLMAKYCFGDPESEDSEILTYADQFLHGLNKLGGLYESASGELDQQDVLTMLPALHCQNALNMHLCWQRFNQKGTAVPKEPDKRKPTNFGENNCSASQKTSYAIARK